MSLFASEKEKKELSERLKGGLTTEVSLRE